MNTVRIPRRRLHARGADGGAALRRLLLVTILCATVFAGFFALGRAASSGGSHREEPWPSLPVASAGTAVPSRLSQAPPIEIEIPQRSSAPEQPHAQAAPLPQAPTPAATTTPPVIAPASAPLVHVAPAPAPVSSSPPAHVRPSIAPPAARPAPATHREGAHSQSGGGVSFDSSG